MAGFSDAYEAGLLTQVFQGTAYRTPTSIHVELYTADPTDADSGTQVSGTGYTAVTLTANTSNFVISTSGTAKRVTVAVDVDYGTAGAGGWGTVGWVGLRDNAGVLVASGPLTTAKAIESGDPVKFNANTLTFDLD